MKPALSAVDITKSVQTELRRVGCYGGSADGEWDKASRLSLEKFNRYAGAELNVKLASLDTLDVIKGKSARVCPLICRHGYKADGDACVKIACGEGKVLNDDNECVARKERKTPSASREREDRRPRRAGRDRFNDELAAPPTAAPRLRGRASAKPDQGADRLRRSHLPSDQARLPNRVSHNRAGRRRSRWRQQSWKSATEQAPPVQIALAAILTISATSAVL